MKLGIISKYYGHGGAGIAAMRLYKAFRRSEYQVFFFCDHSDGVDEIDVIHNSTIINTIRMSISFRLERLQLHLLRSPKGQRSFSYGKSNWPEFLKKFEIDILNVHWVNGHMVPLSDLKRFHGSKLVLTVHDFWPLFDGFFYPSHGDMGLFLASINKLKEYSTLSAIVCVGNWQRDIFKHFDFHPIIEVIPNCIDLSVFRKLYSSEIETNFGIDKRNFDYVIGFGSINNSDYRKGLTLLKFLFSQFHTNSKILILYFGDEVLFDSNNAFTLKCVGFLGERDLSFFYNYIDVFLNPSIFETFGQTSLESISCGTPVLAVDNGGIRDIVAHKVHGYISRPDDPTDFCDGLQWILDNLSNFDYSSWRNYIEEKFSGEVIAKSYMNLFNKISCDNNS
jgi:glycosyltransferase involved in cell wall biosynthesis